MCEIITFVGIVCYLAIENLNTTPVITAIRARGEKIDGRELITTDPFLWSRHVLMPLPTLSYFILITTL